MNLFFRPIVLSSLIRIGRIGGLLLTMMLITSVLIAQDEVDQDHKTWLANMQAINSKIRDPFEIDQRAVKAAGIQKLTGKHIVLYTDVREPKIDELVSVFDKSVSQWCEIFQVKPKQTKHWKMRVFLIANPNDTERFKKIGLLPDHIPEFLAGYQRGPNIWLYLQPGDYYTRHLLLHEGTHAMMEWFLNGSGPPWYSEGMAELVGVHQWKDETIKLNYRLKSRDEAPYWGRVKKIKDNIKDGQFMTLEEVLTIQPQSFLKVRAYAWSWAACDFFNNHSKTKEFFPEIQKQVWREPRVFNRRLLSRLKPHWEELERDWALFVNEIDYGYAVERGQISSAAASSDDPKNPSPSFTIQSDRSWQLTNIELKKGDRIKISGLGEFKVGEFKAGQTDADDSGQTLALPCQSNGITIEYYRGRPLGMLQAAVLAPDGRTARDQIAGLLKPTPIGLSAEITAPSDGLLCLRINESPAKLEDNQGALEVHVEKLE